MRSPMREEFVGSMYTVCRKWKEQSAALALGVP
jgi:hypothetical protein